ncbi:type IX secretion system protein PorQ [Reichenbachiella agarivorans]|uniref:Type IX secretion system protein PorQ n=1 Tax=Reichenbachiella agarivorans TaxID=2979464 RepID=A0ABY6CMY8_9BACT|nr:type IX secretion system protein PorQ [Reichenbachiella agarivorans]UXP30718.1 type IX secretion system protein PorQ [Reichenbachiella agarivorans]
MKKPVLILLLIFQAGLLCAQLDASHSYDFLNLPVGARVAGLGGVVISSTDQDVNLFLSNPALLDSVNHNHISWSHLSYYADVQYNSFAYAWNLKRLGPIGIGVQHMGYGEFDSYDLAGNALGKTSANETAVVLSHSHTLGLFTMGANLRFISSNIDSYGSSALTMDLGGTFTHPTHELQVALLFKNMGVVFSDYTGSSESTLPFDVQMGVTFKPEHMPFRFSVTAYNLGKSGSVYYDADFSEDDEPGKVDEIFRHINLGTEVVISQNFQLRVGYNHLIRKELKMEEKQGLAGISLGAMVRIKMFELSYTFTTYHIDSGRSYFTITSNLNKVFKKKSII